MNERFFTLPARKRQQIIDAGFRVFYEKDPEVCADIRASVEKLMLFRTDARLRDVDPGLFIPGLDIELMYLNMYWASQGYFWEQFQRGSMDAGAMERDFERLIDFWRSVYLRKEGGN